MESEGKQLPFGDDGDLDEAPTGSGTFAELLQQVPCDTDYNMRGVGGGTRADGAYWVGH